LILILTPGSGKTLAFLIPLLESLYRARWSAVDGLGGLVISPTRELSLQIFDVLRLHSLPFGVNPRALHVMAFAARSQPALTFIS
jgi:superfamily II DNA/RNA helicase